MTALTTVPFLVWPSGAASFTLAVMTSPSPALKPVEPPSGRIICSLRAPELSATSSIDLIITAIIPDLPQPVPTGRASTSNRVRRNLVSWLPPPQLPAPAPRAAQSVSAATASAWTEDESPPGGPHPPHGLRFSRRGHRTSW